VRPCPNHGRSNPLDPNEVIHGAHVFVRRATASLAPGCLTPARLARRTASNYHVLTNGADALFFGIGAGGTQTAADGIGTFIAGEDLRGSHLTALGDFGFRSPSFTENACVLQGHPARRALALKFPAITFTSWTGSTATRRRSSPTRPARCPASRSGHQRLRPYGTGPGSTASFVLPALPSAVGLRSSHVFLPNNGLAPSARRHGHAHGGAAPRCPSPPPASAGR
jgi:hypothetical protein